MNKSPAARQDIANLLAAAHEAMYQLAKPLLVRCGLTAADQLKPPYAWRWERDEIIAQEFELHRQRWLELVGGPS